MKHKEQIQEENINKNENNIYSDNKKEIKIA